MDNISSQHSPVVGVVGGVNEQRGLGAAFSGGTAHTTR